MIALMHEFVPISDLCSVPVSRIVTIIDAETYQGKALRKEKKADGTLLDTSGNKVARSILILDNGAIIAGTKSVKELTEQINFVSKRIISEGGEIGPGSKQS